MAQQLPCVYITRPDVEPDGLALLKQHCNVTTWTKPEPVPRDILLQQVQGAHAIYCTIRDRIDAEVLDKAGPQLKCVVTISVGYDHIDVAECKRRGIRIGYALDAGTDSTAELTVALLLATSRRLLEANQIVHTGGWKSWMADWMCGQGVKGSRVGIFGFGRIGQEVAARILPFKPSALCYNSRTARPEEAARTGAQFVSFDELLQNSDFIIACCALTAETSGIFNSAAFSKMRPNAIFINTSRGGVVNQSDLYEALSEKRIKAAGLDVTTPEPLPLDDPLLQLDNVVIMPHIGSAETNTRKEMSRYTVLNILAGLDNKEMIAEL